jgi:hypothetical protein
MPQYSFFIVNSQGRVKYPRSFALADVDAARGAAVRIARVFAEVVPYWSDLSADQRNDFVVDIVDAAGQTVLTVPFREVEEPEAQPDRAHASKRKGS